MNYLKFVTVCIIFSCFVVGCSDSATEKSDAAVSSTGSVTTMAAKPDMGKLKASIQALENSWATADNARDTNAIAAVYAEDAISYSNNKPMLVGRAAIQKDIAAGIAKRAKGATVACDKWMFSAMKMQLLKPVKLLLKMHQERLHTRASMWQFGKCGMVIIFV